MNHHSDAASAAGKKLLLVNVDETHVLCYDGSARGTVSARSSILKCPLQASKRKKSVTYVASIANHFPAQSKLRRYVLGNEQTFKQKDMASLTHIAGAKLMVVRSRALLVFNFVLQVFCRQKSAWVDAGFCARLVRDMANDLREFREEFILGLVWDALPAHLAPCVLAACKSTGILPIVIPARTTFMLQPLDSHVFSSFKRIIRERYDERRVVGGGRDDVCSFMQGMREATEQVLLRDWAHAFQQNGFNSDRRQLSAEITARVSMKNMWTLCAPTLDDLSLCVPARQRRAAAFIFSRFVSNQNFEAPKKRLRSEAAAASSSRSHKIVCGRTRSETRAMNGDVHKGVSWNGDC